MRFIRMAFAAAACCAILGLTACDEMGTPSSGQENPTVSSTTSNEQTESSTDSAPATTTAIPASATTTHPTTTAGSATTTRPATTKAATTRMVTTARPTTTKAPTTQATAATTEKVSQTVYITPTGERYHLISTCGGKNSRPVSLEEALRRGLTPCKKCAQ